MDQLVSARSSRVVAFARALMSGFLLLSVTVGSLKYDEAQHTALIILEVFFVYSVLILAAVRTVQLRRHLFRAALALAVVDVLVLSSLLYFTQGPNSPFFSPLIFIILSGTVQWGSRGAIWSGLLVTVLFVPTGLRSGVFAEGHRDGLQLFLVRIGYIAMISSMLAAFASHLERLINELARLSLPVPSRSDSEEMPLAECLGHACAVFGARRGVAVWQDPEEPHLQLARLDFGSAHHSTLPAVDQGPLVAPELVDAAFLYDRGRRISLYRANNQLRDFSGTPFQPMLDQLTDYDRVLVIPVQAAGAQGLVMILDPVDPANEELAIAAMVGGQISLTLEAWQLHADRRVAAAAEERIRLARDLHDGVLQFLAGARLQLDLIGRTELDEPARDRLQQMSEAIAVEQRELRAVIGAMRRAPAPGPTKLASALDRLADHLSRSWDAAVTTKVTPLDLHVSEAVEEDVVRIAREAVANAVRHGHSREIRIEVRQAGAALEIAINDNGRGFGFDGVMANGELASYAGRPRSLHDRITSMGGSMTLTSAKTGTRLDIAVPLRAVG
jgi:signal transduction histidine kinase